MFTAVNFNEAFLRARMLVAAVALASILLVDIQPARAELPPEAYIKMQKEAAEVLTIHVPKVTVETESSPGRIKTTVTATVKVVKVERSKSGLKNGATITIYYVQDISDPPVPGPGAIPVLKAGKTCPAYLQRVGDKGSQYRPAAGGYSFEKVASKEKAS